MQCRVLTMGLILRLAEISKDSYEGPRTHAHPTKFMLALLARHVAGINALL
jgi:hypothetical protein